MPEDLFDSAAKELAGVNTVAPKASRNLFDDASDELNGVSSKLQIPSPDQVVKQTTANIDKARGSLGSPNAGVMSDEQWGKFKQQGIKESRDDAFGTAATGAALATGGLSEALPAGAPNIIKILTSMLGQGTVPYEAGHAAGNATAKALGGQKEPRNLPAEGLATILPGVISGMQIRGAKSQAAQALQDKLAGLKSQAETTAKNIPTNKINILKNQGALDATEVATQRKLTDLNQSIIQQKADLAKLQSQAQSGGKVMGKLYGRQADEAKQALAELTIQREQLKDPTLQAVQPQRNINSSKIRIVENQEELRQLKNQIADLEGQTPSATNKAKLTPLIKKAAVLMGLAGGGWGAAKLTHLL